MFMTLVNTLRIFFQRNDIAMAITKYDMFDFLIDIVPRDELKPNKRQVQYCTLHNNTLVPVL